MFLFKSRYRVSPALPVKDEANDEENEIADEEKLHTSVYESSAYSMIMNTKMKSILPSRCKCVHQQKISIDNTPMNSNSNVRLGLEHAISFVEMVPIPMCIINTAGDIVGSNSEFRSTVWFDGSSRCSSSNIMEVIYPEDLDKFYTNLRRLNSDLSMKLNDLADSYWTRITVDEQRKKVQYNWTIGSDCNQDVILLTGRPAREVPINESEDTISRRYVPTGHIDWDQFRSIFETKTQRYIELRESKLQSRTLAATLEMKRKFVRKINHEVRTPLHVVSTVLEMLVHNRSQLSPAAAELVEEANGACGVAVDILDDLLTYEQLSEMTLDKAMHDLLQILQRCLGFYLIEAKNAGIEILMVNTSTRTQLLVEVDKPKVSQVLRNLLSNAMKFTPKGGRVTVTVSLETLCVRVVMHNTGPSLSRKAREQMFHEDSRPNLDELHSNQGEGIGLHICQQIIQLHNGVIGVDAAWNGIGSRFFIELPVLKEADDTVDSIAPTAPLPVIEEISLRLLVVDDSATCRKLHGRSLGVSCTELLEAANGQEAVEIISTSIKRCQAIDGILMDSSMPVMNGTTATKMIRDMGYTGPIFGVTGNAFQADVDDFLAHGVDEVLIKPLKMDKYQYIVHAFAAHQNAVAAF